MWLWRRLEEVVAAWIHQAATTWEQTHVFTIQYTSPPTALADTTKMYILVVGISLWNDPTPSANAPLPSDHNARLVSTKCALTENLSKLKLITTGVAVVAFILHHTESLNVQYQYVGKTFIIYTNVLNSLLTQQYSELLHNETRHSTFLHAINRKETRHTNQKQTWRLDPNTSNFPKTHTPLGINDS